jgi:hypothetical protein
MFPKMRPKVEYTDFLFDRGVISFDELIYIGNSKDLNEKNRRRNEVLTKRDVNKEYMRRLYRNLVIEECEEVYGQGVIIRGIRSASNELGLKENQFRHLMDEGYIKPLSREVGGHYRFILDDLLNGYKKYTKELEENNGWGE